MQVIGIGEKKTPNPFIVACDRFIYIEILKKQTEEKIENKEILESTVDSITKKETLFQLQSTIYQMKMDGHF